MANNLFWISLRLFSILIVAEVYAEQADDFPLACGSKIFCYGDLLETIQLSEVFAERKIFVDLSLLHPPDQVYASFLALNFSGDVQGNPIQFEQLNKFATENFQAEPGYEFDNVTFDDWTANPEFLANISDLDFRDWASKLHSIWNDLGRQIKKDVEGSDRTTMIYSPNPMVVPGGRFREFYYWDSYWIQRGLLVSGMGRTVRGMIDNFLDMVKQLDYVPNGGRIYYERSQPPLLLPMVDAYYEDSGDVEFIRENLWLMEQEFRFWMNNRTVAFEKGGVNYTMARYAVNRKGPRPEALEKEYRIIEAMNIPRENMSMIYSHTKSACESGWDFSTRWYILDDWEAGQKLGFEHTKTRDIIPVDLNAFLYWNAVILDKFCVLIGNSNCTYYADKAVELKTGIHKVLWDEESGSWYDYDWVRGSLRKAFYTSNLAPLWVKAHHAPEAVTRLLSNLDGYGALSYPAGVPTSLDNETSQQWDFPNAWPPLVHMVVEALENSGNEDAKRHAFRIAQNWADANYIGWKLFGGMFEKYDVTKPGCRGTGGYYETVVGFGWTNGVVLDFLQKYGDRLVHPTVPDKLDCNATDTGSLAGRINFNVCVHLTLGLWLVIRSLAFP